MAKQLTVTVIGAGVIGLTCACELALEHKVRVVADAVGTETNSNNATAIWHVYLVPETKDVLEWAKQTLEKLVELNRTVPDAKVSMIKGVELFRNGSQSVPMWSQIPPEFRFLNRAEIDAYNNFDIEGLTVAEIQSLRARPVRWGYHISAPIVRMDEYLPWLHGLALKRGVIFENSRVVHFDDVATGSDVLVNCAGIGARELADDSSFKLFKGQYLILRGKGAPDEYLGDDDHPGGMAYFIPRAGEVLIGGCAEEGIETPEFTLSWDDVVRRAGLYVRWLRGKTQSDQARAPVVCFRPARLDGVRLERTSTKKGIPLIHNYGHGGSGFSLSWGCAKSVTRLISM